MELNIHGNHVGITDRFVEYVNGKIAKVEQLAPKALSLEIRVSRISERSPKNGDHVEMRLFEAGPTICSESQGVDKYAAFDIAFAKMLEQLRRHKDKAHDRRGHRRDSVRLMPAAG